MLNKRTPRRAAVDPSESMFMHLFSVNRNVIGCNPGKEAAYGNANFWNSKQIGLTNNGGSR